MVISGWQRAFRTVPAPEDHLRLLRTDANPRKGDAAVPPGFGQPPAHLRGDGEEQLIVVAARQRCRRYILALRGKPFTGTRLDRQRVRVDNGADAAGAGDLVDAVREPVAQ